MLLQTISHIKHTMEATKNRIQLAIWQKAIDANNTEKAAEIRVALLHKLGISPKMLTYILENISQPSLEQLKAAAQVIGCGVEDLIQ